MVAENLKKVLPEELYRVRTYEDRTERNLETVDTLTDYITLILLVSSIFAFVILRSAHESFFESLARTLRVTEILGLTRRRQQVLLLMLYGLIFPIAFVLSVGLADIIIESIRRIPEASEFVFYWSAVPYAGILLVLIVVMSWFPAWWMMGRSEEEQSKAKSPILSFRRKEESALKSKNGQVLHSFSLTIKQKLVRLEILIPLLLGIIVLFLLFGSPVFSLAVGV